jgi:hypothetical protein
MTQNFLHNDYILPHNYSASLIGPNYEHWSDVQPNFQNSYSLSIFGEISLYQIDFEPWVEMQQNFGWV